MISIIKILLRRMYAHIFSYRQSENITSDIQRKYTLKNGNGKKSIRYIALGDSLTYGFGASNHRRTFPYLLSKKLLKKYNYHIVEVINLAECGATVDDLLHKQLPQTIKKKPNFITVLIGTNDVHSFANLGKFRNSLENIINQLKKSTNAQILIINIPYLISNYMTFPPYNKIADMKIKKFNLVIQDIANSKAVKYFDLYIHTKDFFKKGSDLYSSDWFHPSDKGYILWGNLININ